MIITKTTSVRDKNILNYLGVVTGEAIIKGKHYPEFFAYADGKNNRIADVYKKELNKARNQAFKEIKRKAKDLGGTAIIGVDVANNVITDGFLTVSVSGTAVRTN